MSPRCHPLAHLIGDQRKRDSGHRDDLHHFSMTTHAPDRDPPDGATWGTGLAVYSGRPNARREFICRASAVMQ